MIYSEYMDPQKQALRNYIDEQRSYGISDEALLRNLISNGWPADIARQALAPVNYNATSQPSGSSTGFFSGRIGRIGYLLGILYVLSYFIVPIILTLLVRSSKIVNIVTVLMDAVGLLALFPALISLQIRRWHDLDQSGWMTLLGLVPIVGFLASLALFVIPGTTGENKYGHPYTGRLSPLYLFGKKK
jgi:uncharacterized membrane protein YhaH (DUF805 family)